MNLIRCDSRAEWLAQRRKGVGASDVACLMGVPELSRFTSPWSIWQNIVDSPEDEDAGELADMGHRLEPVISDLFRDKAEFDGVIDDPGDFTIVQSEETPIAMSTVDRFICDVSHPPDPALLPVRINKAVLELKAAWYAQAKKLIENVPLVWQCQVQWQMYCCELDLGYFAVLLDGYEFRWYRIERHEKLIKAMLKRATDFWDRYVIPEVPPPADYTQATQRAIAKHYSEPKDEVVVLPQDATTWKDTLEHWNAKEAEAKRHISEAKNKLRAAIGNATFGLLNGEYGYSLRPNKNGVRSLKYGKRK